MAAQNEAEKNRFRDLAVKAVKCYLRANAPFGNNSIKKFSHYLEGEEVKEGMFSFEAQTYSGRALVVVVDPKKNTLQVTDVETDIVATYHYLDLGFLVLLPF